MEDPYEKPHITEGELFIWKEDVKPNVGNRRPLGYGSAAAAQGGSEAEFVKYAERRVASRIVESRRKLPPMINDSALFTLASPYGAPKDPYYHAPSTRIASHYTPGAGFASAVLFEEFPQNPNAPRKPAKRALSEIRSVFSSSGTLSRAQMASLTHSQSSIFRDPALATGLDSKLLPPMKKAKAGSPDSPSDFPSESLSMEHIPLAYKAFSDMTDEERESIYDAVLRYHYYVEAGVNPAHVAMFREDWWINALSLTPHETQVNVSPDYYHELLHESRTEMEDDYDRAMRKAIVDYVLASPVQRDRLGMDALEPVMNQIAYFADNWRACVAREVPEPWRQSIGAARESIAWSLQNLSTQALELNNLWLTQGFVDRLLVDVLSSDFTRQLPMDIESFKSHQTGICEKAKGALWSTWLPKCHEIFTRLPPIPINADAEAYFRCISAQVSLQFRGLVKDSLDSFVAFFKEHEAKHEVDTHASIYAWSQPPVFVVEIGPDAEGNIVFVPSFAEIAHEVDIVLDNFVLAVSGIPRVEHSSSYLSGGVPPHGARSIEIPTVDVEEDFVRMARGEIAMLLAENTRAPYRLAEMFRPYLYLINSGAEDWLQQFADSGPNKDQLAERIDKLRADAAAIRSLCMNDLRTGIYVVRTREFKERLASQADELVTRLLDHVRDRQCVMNSHVCEAYAAMQSDLGKVSNSGEEVLSLKKYIQRCQLEQERLRDEISISKDWDEFFFKYRYEVPEEDFALAMKAYEWPKKMVEVMKEAVSKANTEHRIFEDQLKKRRAAFAEQLRQWAEEVESFATFGDVLKRNQLADTAQDLMERLRSAHTEAEEINTQEKMFGWAQTKYVQLAQMINRLEPFVTLWTTTAVFYDKHHDWMNGPFSRLESEAVEAEVMDSYRKLYKLQKIFGGAGGAEVLASPLEVSNVVMARIEGFKEHVPLIMSICNPGLRERHWHRISTIVGFEIKPDAVTSLKYLLDKEVGRKVKDIENISDYASREWSIEKQMDKMLGDWNGLAFELGEWKDTGTYILKGGPVDEAQMLLDDHIVKSQAMSASPFAKPFEHRLIPWERKLRRLQDILDQWLRCQGKWLYLEPIFGSDEIMKQIPLLGSAFKSMDGIWRSIMQRVKTNPVVLEVADFEGLLEDLVDCNENLDVVEKGLNDFLDTKKLAFPRFFFLSNDELLEILSEAKDPLNIQPFVKKCFEAVKDLQFETNGEISGMTSVELEKIPWNESVNPARIGAVERWLLEVESVMKKTLHKLAEESLEAYPKVDRSQWILQWPGQLVLNCSQVFWTKEVEEAIQHGGANGLRQYGARCTEELNKIVTLVRGQLTSLERATCGSLVVIDVHARDVVGHMAGQGVASIKDFDWESQMRYYWEHDELPPSGLPAQETIVVRMINAMALYGYEYLGNSGRLVITPLTDRCYRTLTGAIHMNLGGAPAGPAGTGKTETTKDLSKALAIQCVVFNCSDGLDFKAMGKFFKGLACSGAWACFDEFNRIELEVLSVVAQQILTIQRAKVIRAKTFVFEGIEIRLVMTANCFITMNPGYAGRSELPDNLKALFRDVAMVIPDYAMIAEIMLYSYGYLDARSMARKLVQTYRLCSEQLSSQDHYDYGMRAVMSVLRAAGNLKRKFADEKEDVLMLRAINDVNLPKFLDQDVPLFEGILGDLFPGVKLPELDYGHLLHALKDNAVRMGLQPLNSFMIKMIQLYEMIIVRHGLMLVGDSFGMKTAAYRVLAGALTDLSKKGLMGEQKVKVYCLNPKSVSMGQLYGQEDAVSKEWTDGVLAVLFRNAARDTSQDRKWIMFDGPVDAVWIENMNTVLDDNKKLCLNSGEIIAMQGLMNMIFEVGDLAVASPATVSRCGMVYHQPSLLGWRPVMLSWIATLPPGVTEAHREQIMALFDWLLPPTMRVAQKMTRRSLPVQDINMAVSCMRIMESLLDEFRDTPDRIQEMNVNVQNLWIQSIFLFALVWSVGGCTDEDGRRKFDAILRRLIVNDVPGELKQHVKAPAVPITQLFPEGKLVYDFTFDKTRQKWVPWMEIIESVALDPEMEYSDIIVPTADTVRYNYILDKLVPHHFHVLLVGTTGTGKTVYVKRYLQQVMSHDKFAYMMMNFSAQTSANMTQDIIDGKLDKRKKGTYGPPPGKRMAIFVDDLNMPKLEVYGAQPPIELLRQWMDHGGWYDRKELVFRSIVDVQFIAAMGPPGGGRNSVTNRYLRHFCVVSLTTFDQETNQLIFTTLVDCWFRRHNYDQSISKYGKSIVLSTIELFETVQRELLPTPTKSHYTFNLRDLSKVFQGMTVAANAVKDSGMLIRLWIHEALRVFYDRLIDDNDRNWMLKAIEEIVERQFKEKFHRVVARAENKDAKLTMQDLRHNLFGDYMVPGAVPRLYSEVPSLENMTTVVAEYMNDFNATSKKPMHLVLFQFALEHVSRICRIIRQSGGHALLVGLGGSGRQSLTRLAAFIEEFELFQIEISKTYSINDWRDDLRKVLKMAGEANKKVVFLFSDTTIKDESFIEDISNILNTYEVPNLLGAGDLAGIFENIRTRAKLAGMDGTRELLYQFFIQECRRNLHIVLTFSPVGEAFRERLRKFPSLVNCTTIDWFTRWPNDALRNVAASMLSSSLRDIPEPVMDALPDLCVLFHESVHRLKDRFLAEQRRYYYVTPTSYLELLTSYKTLLNKKQGEISLVKKRYEIGLEKLAQTEGSVQGMQEELIALQPQLDAAVKETDAAMVVINQETAEADKVRVVVERDENIAAEEAAKVKAIKDECEADLAEALPLLEAALRALDTLSKNDITEVKGMKSPPKGVKLVLEAVCILKNVKPVRIKDPQSGRMVDDYWGASLKMLMESDFLDSLRTYDKDHIDPKIILAIKPYIDNPEFEPEKIKQASKAAYGLCCWCRAMEAYDRVVKVVEPKRQKLAESEAELAIVMAGLREKQAELKVVMDKLAALNADLAEKKSNKDRLEREVQQCAVKLDRAQKLIKGLGGEKTRWTAAANSLASQFVQLAGDVLLSAGQIAYLGPFTQSYRSDVLKSWVVACKERGIPCSDKFSLTAVLGEPVKIRQWNIQGLSKDDFSAENAITIDQGRRWPLCIDPQGLANKWIRTMEADRKLKVIKLTDGNFLRTLENAIPFGIPVLLENVPEYLDAALEPLLQKQTFKQGGALCIKLGDATVEYSEDFKFYVTTKLRNPHYPPELCTQVSLLNFVTTMEGLEDQLLGIVVAKERPDLEEEKNKLIIQGADNKRKLKEIEDEILRVLSASEGNILEDEAAVNILQSSKVLADEISEKQKIADETEQKIDEARAGYKPVAKHSSILYFCVTDMGNIDPMYQYSLSWYVNLFLRAITDSQQSDDLEERLRILNDYFTFLLYQNVCRSLFEKDKLLFAFVLCTKLLLNESKIHGAELRFLLTGGVAMGDTGFENPAPDWISTKMWGEACRADDLGGSFAGLRDDLIANHAAWRDIYDATEPQQVPLPGAWATQLDDFQKLIVLRVIRSDKLTPAITSFVAKVMGERFVEPVPFAIEPSFNDSGPTMPLIFVLSPGSDPMANLLKFADDRGTRVETVSLGQGQGPVAERWIQEGMKDGFWVVLQNCHLAKSFLPTLELICEQQLVPGKVHRDFRLWLTSYPSEIFPISILENGVKMTNEAPKGLRAGLLRTFMMDPICNQDFFSGSRKDAEFRKMLFGLAFFHSIIVERRKYGPIGWNIPYEFNENDLRISVRQLRMFLDEYPEIPYNTLQYTCGECNYGGKVTDSHDRHTLMTILHDYYTLNILKDDHKLSPSGLYYVPKYTSFDGYMDYINSLPLISQPEVFGFHENADITKDLKETNQLLDSLMLTQSRDSGGGGVSFEETIREVSEDILARLPANFDLEATSLKYPQDYNNSMSTVLIQELERFNNLLTLIRSSLVNLGKAVKGLALMSTELDQVGRSLYDGKVPTLWLKRSFASLKPLGPYVKECLERCRFFQAWIDHGSPTVFWISGFFFTQAFLTGAKQNFARKYRIPIDMVDFDYQIMDGPDDCKTPPEDGVYCEGLFLEGCRWDYDEHVLAESEPKVLFTKMPKIWMIPAETDKFKDYSNYNAPLYKQSERRGVLSTTGHSTNFVCDIRLPSKHDAAHWVRRGVCLLASLDYDS